MSDIITNVVDGVTGLSGAFVDIITNILDLFYVSPDGTAPKQLTILGVMGLLGLSLFMVRWGVGFIRGFFRR